MTSPKWRVSKYRKIAISGLALSGLFLTAGCSAIQSFTDSVFGGSGNTAIAWASESAGDPIWTVETRSVGNGPQIVGNTVLSYIWEDSQLGLAGYDIETGEQKWFQAGVTGSLNPSYPLRMWTFRSTDGTPLVANISEAQSTTPDSEGHYKWKHPIQVIEVETGEVRGTSPAEVFAVTAQNCIPMEIACGGGYIEDSLGIIGINENAEILSDPNLTALADYESVHYAAPNGFASGIAKDGTPLGTYVKDGEAQWSVPPLEMGFEGLTQNDKAGFFDDFFIYSLPYKEEGVVVASGGTNTKSLGVSDFHTTGFDIKTGEILWQNDNQLCWDDVLCEGDLNFETDSDGIRTHPPQDITLSGFSPATGEETWTVNVKGLKISDTEGWSLGGGGAIVLNTSDGHSILDTSTGKIVEITEEQSFHCRTDGVAFRQNEAGVPERKAVSYKKNYITVSCGLTGESSDPSVFSKGTVAYGSKIPYGFQVSDWDTFEEQTRVIATEDGFAAYRF